jgi:hypothetical protein
LADIFPGTAAIVTFLFLLVDTFFGTAASVTFFFLLADTFPGTAASVTFFFLLFCTFPETALNSFEKRQEGTCRFSKEYGKFKGFLLLRS